MIKKNINPIFLSIVFVIATLTYPLCALALLSSEESLSTTPDFGASFKNFNDSTQQFSEPGEVTIQPQETAVTDDLSTCTDKKLGIQFSCDPDWRIETDENVLMIIINEQPNVTLTITRTTPAPPSLEDLTMSVLKEIGSYADGFTVYRTTLNGQPVVEVRGSSAKVPDLQLHDYYILEQGTLFGILFAVKPFDALTIYDPMIKKLISTFKILPVGTHS